MFHVEQEIDFRLEKYLKKALRKRCAGVFLCVKFYVPRGTSYIDKKENEDKSCFVVTHFSFNGLLS